MGNNYIFDKNNKTWYQVNKDGSRQPVGHNAIVQVYDKQDLDPQRANQPETIIPRWSLDPNKSSFSTLSDSYEYVPTYKRLTPEGEMENSDETSYKDYLSILHPSSFTDHLASIASFTPLYLKHTHIPGMSNVGAIVEGVNTLSKDVGIVDETYKDKRNRIFLEQEDAERRDKESFKDLEEVDRSYVANLYQVLKDNSLASLSERQAALYQKKYGDRNKAFKENPGGIILDEGELFKARTLEDIMPEGYIQNKLYGLVDNPSAYGYVDLMQIAKYMAEEQDDPSLLNSINLDITYLIADKYGKTAKEYESDAKTLSQNTALGFGALAAEHQANSLKNNKDLHEQTLAEGLDEIALALNLPERFSRSLKNELINNEYKNEQRDRVLNLINEASDAYATSLLLNELNPYTLLNDLVKAEFAFSLVYQDYKEHIGRIWGDTNNSSEKLKLYYQYSYMLQSMGENAALKWLADTLKSKDYEGTGFWNRVVLGTMGVGTELVNVMGSAANFLAYYNPFTFIGFSLAGGEGEEAWYDSWYRYSINNSFRNYFEDLKTTGAWSVEELNARKYGRSYNALELTDFLNADLIDEETYQKALEANEILEKTSGWNSWSNLSGKRGTTDRIEARKNLVLKYGEGATGEWTVWNRDAGKETDILNWGSVPEVLAVAVLMLGVKSTAGMMNLIGTRLNTIGQGLKANAAIMKGLSATTKAGMHGRAVNLVGKGFTGFGTLTNALSPSVSSLQLDFGYAKSAFDLNTATANLFVHSEPFKEYIDASLSKITGENASNFLQINKETSDNLLNTDFIFKLKWENIEKNEELSLQNKEVAKARLLQETVTKNNYLRAAEDAAYHSAAITWALTGMVDVVNANTISKTFYDAKAPRVSKFINKTTSWLNPRKMFKDFSFEKVGETAKVAAKLITKGDIYKSRLLNAYTSFMSNYFQDLGVGAGENVYNGNMDLYTKIYFNKNNVTDTLHLLDILSQAHTLSLGLAGANNAIALWTSIRDGFYGGVAGLFFNVSLKDMKTIKNNLNKARNSIGTDTNFFTKIGTLGKALNPITADMGMLTDLRYMRKEGIKVGGLTIIPNYLNKEGKRTWADHPMLKEANINRDQAAKAIEVFINSDEGKAFQRFFPQLNYWNNQLLTGIANKDMNLVNNAQNKMMITSAFVTAAMSNNAYGLAIINRANKTASRLEFTSLQIQKLYNKYKQLQDILNKNNKPLKSEQLTDEECLIAEDIMYIAKALNIDIANHPEKVAEELNKLTTNAKEYLLMIKDIERYSREAQEISGETDNFVLTQAYAETRTYYNFLKRNFDRKQEEYKKKLEDAFGKHTFKVYDTDDDKESNIPPTLAGALRLLFQGQSSIEKEISDRKSDVELAKANINEAYEQYKQSIKNLKEKGAKATEEDIYNHNLIQLSLMLFKLAHEQAKKDLKEAEEAAKLNTVATEVNVLDDEGIHKITKIHDFKISSKDILRMSPEALHKLLSLYKADKLNTSLKYAVEHALEYLVENEVDSKKAADIMLSEINTMMNSKSLSELIAAEIENTKDLNNLSSLISTLAKERESQYYREVYKEFAEQNFASYEDFVLKLRDKQNEIIELNPDTYENKLEGLHKALEHNEYFKQYAARDTEYTSIQIHSDKFLDPHFEAIKRDFTDILYRLIVDNNYSLGGKLLFKTKSLESNIDEIFNKIKEVIEKATDEDIKKALNKENMTSDEISAEKDALIKYSKALLEFIKQIQADNLTHDEGIPKPDEKKTKEKVLTQREKNKKALVEAIKTGKSTRDILKDILSFTNTNFLNSLSKEGINKTVFNILNAYAGNRFEPFPKDMSYYTVLIKCLEDKIGPLSKVANQNQRYSVANTNNAIYFGDAESTDVDQRLIAEKCAEYNVLQFIKGSKLPIININTGKDVNGKPFIIRLLAGDNLEINNGKGVYYPIAIPVTWTTKSTPEYGNPITIDGQAYLIIGFYKADSKLDASSNKLRLLAKNGKDLYLIDITLSTHLNKLTNTNEGLPVEPQVITKTSTFTQSHFRIENGELRYYEGGASLIELQRDNYTVVLVSEIANTKRKDGQSLSTVETKRDFNSHTLKFTNALKAALKIFDTNGIKAFNEAINKKANKSKEISETDGAGYYGELTKASYNASLMKSIYLANNWEYSLLKDKENNEYVFVITNKDISHALGRISIADYENTETREASINKFIEDILTSIGNEKSLEDKELIEKSTGLPICKWEISYAQFMPDTREVVNTSKAQHVSEYLDDLLLVHYPNEVIIQPDLCKVNILLTDSEAAERKNRALREKLEALKAQANKSALESLTLGEPEKVGNIDSEKIRLQEVLKYINKVKTLISLYYKKMAESDRSGWYDKVKESTTEWLLQGHIDKNFPRPTWETGTKEYKEGADWGITGTALDFLGRDLFGAKDLESITWETNYPYKTRDNTIKKYKDVYGVMFTEQEFNLFKEMVIRIKKDLQIASDEVEILTTGVIAGSKGKFLRELDMLLLDRRTGILYNIDFKKVTMSKTDTLNHIHNTRRNEQGVLLKKEYMKEIIQQNLWLKWTLYQEDPSILIPEIRSALLYMPVNSKISWNTTPVNSITLSQREGATWKPITYTNKEHKVIKVLRSGFTSSRDKSYFNMLDNALIVTDPNLLAELMQEAIDEMIKLYRDSDNPTIEEEQAFKEFLENNRPDKLKQTKISTEESRPEMVEEEKQGYQRAMDNHAEDSLESLQNLLKDSKESFENAPDSKSKDYYQGRIKAIEELITKKQQPSEEAIKNSSSADLVLNDFKERIDKATTEEELSTIKEEVKKVYLNIQDLDVKKAKLTLTELIRKKKETFNSKPNRPRRGIGITPIKPTLKAISSIATLASIYSMNSDFIDSFSDYLQLQISFCL